jgi:hypothetical protein
MKAFIRMRVYRMPSGGWYWQCDCGQRSTEGGFGGFAPYRGEAPFRSRSAALDGLAQHINFSHSARFKSEGEKLGPPDSMKDRWTWEEQGGIWGQIGRAVDEYSKSREAIRRSLDKRVER